MLWLALDLGRTTGWATGSPSLLNVQSGTWDLTPKKKKSACLSYLLFADHLNDAPDTVTHVVYEKVARHKGTRAAHVYGAYEAMLELWCLGRDLPLHGVGVGSLKKETTGIGNASKEQMIQSLQFRGFEVTDHNQADALALLLYAVTHLI